MATLCFVISVVVGVYAWHAKDQAEDARAQVQNSNDRADRFIDDTLHQLHQQLVGLGRVGLLENPARKAVELLKQQEHDEGGMSDDQLRFQESVYGTLGDVFRSNNDLADVVPQYRASIDDAQKLYDRHKADNDTEKLTYEKDLSEKRSGPANTLVDGSLADALIYETKPDEVALLYKESGQILGDVERSAQNPRISFGVQRQRSNLDGRLGDLHRLLGDYAQAGDFYQKSFGVRKAIADSNPDREDYQYDLVNAYSRISLLNATLGHFNTAFQAGESAREIRENMRNVTLMMSPGRGSFFIVTLPWAGC